MTELLSEFDVGQLTLCTSRKATHGIVSQPLLYKQQRQAEAQLDGEVVWACNLSAFDGSSTTRLTATFSITDEQHKLIQNIENAVSKLANSPVRPNVKLREGWPPMFKLKVDTDRLLVYDTAGTIIPSPVDWQGARFKIVISPRSFYQQAQGNGLIWDLIAIQTMGAVAHKVSFR